eukprot:COSAG05_NODE_7025_length_865_cov_0.954308_2_plen_97_part_00
MQKSSKGLLKVPTSVISLLTCGSTIHQSSRLQAPILVLVDLFEYLVDMGVIFRGQYFYLPGDLEELRSFLVERPGPADGADYAGVDPRRTGTTQLA